MGYHVATSPRVSDRQSSREVTLPPLLCMHLTPLMECEHERCKQMVQRFMLTDG